MLNPVFQVEAVRSARRGRHYLLRVASGLVLLLYLASEYAAWEAEMHQHSIQWLGRFARAAFARFAILQDLAILVLVPALTAGAIAEEDRRRTLPDLLASRLTAAEIILGKLASRLIHVAFFVLLGLPAVALLGLIGGLEPAVVAAVYGGTASLTLFAAGISILSSTLLRRPRDAIAATYGVLAVWLIVPWMIGSTFGRPGWPLFGPAGSLPRSFLRFSPILTWLRLWIIAGNTTLPGVHPALLSWVVRVLWADLPWMIGVQSVLGLVFLALAVVALRSLRGAPSGTGQRRRERRAPTRPPCDDNPMLWKERYAAGAGPWLRWAGWAMGGLILVPLAYDLLRHVLRVFSIRAELGYFPGWSLGSDFSDALRSAHMALFVIWELAVAGAAALGVTGEREGETWDALRTTTMSGREVVLAKQFGAAWGSRGLFGMLLIVWIVGLASGALHPLGVLAAWLGLAVFTWFAAALGTAVSLRARDSTRALVVTSAALLLTNVGYLIPLLALWPTSAQSPLSLLGISPYLEWAVLFPPWVFQPWWNSVSYPTMIGPLIAYEGPAVLPAFALGLILYASAALILTFFSIRAYDATAPRQRGSQGGSRAAGWPG